MIALSNTCTIYPTLSLDKDCTMLCTHGTANEPHESWEGMSHAPNERKLLKQQRSKVLCESIESIMPDCEERVVCEIIGSPLTHEMCLLRPRGACGAATEDYLTSGEAPVDNLFSHGDDVFLVLVHLLSH